MDSYEGAQPGTEVTLKLSFVGNFSFNIFDGVITYDSSILKVVKVEEGSLLTEAGEGAAVSIDFESTPGKVKLAIASNDPIVSERHDGTVVSVTFKVIGPFDEVTNIGLTVNEFELLAENATEATPVDYIIQEVATDAIATITPADPVEFVVTSKEGVKPNTEVTVEFKLSGVYQAHILNAYIDFDTDALTLVSVTKGSIFGDNNVVIDYETVPGSIRLALVCADEPISAEGVILKITFKTAEDFAAETPLKLRINQFAYMGVDDAEPIDLNYTATNGKITPYVPNPWGLASAVGIGIVSIAAGAGVVVFRKKED